MKLLRFLNESEDFLKRWEDYKRQNKMLGAAIKILKKVR